MKVVVGVDGSKYGRWAVEWAARLPFAKPPKVIAVHVVDLHALRAPLSMVQPILVAHTEMLAREIRKLHARAKAIKAETATLLKKLKLSGRAVIERGPVMPSLLKYCGNDTMLTVGHRSLGTVDQLMIGSVSSQVVTHAGCPVLVAKKPPLRSVRHLVLATDGSKESEKAERFVIKQFGGASASNVEVVVVHVMPFLRYPELKNAAAALVHSRSERLAKEGFKVIEAPKLGHPADEIMKAAAYHKAELIVAGARGIGAIAGTLLGSVSRKLVQQSTCSVLLVR